MRLLPALVLTGLAVLAASLGAAEESFEDLLANLKSPTARTRLSAATALGKSRRRDAVAPLSALVRDPEPRVRLEVVNALRSLRDASAVPALVTSLQDGDPKVREEAISALVEIYAERDRGGPIERFLQAFSDEYERTSVAPYTAVSAAVFKGLAGTLPRRTEEHPRRIRLRDRHPGRRVRGGRAGDRRAGSRSRGPGGGGHGAREGGDGRARASRSSRCSTTTR